MSAPSANAAPEPLSLRIKRFAARIRNKLLVANVILVILPVAGLSFARTYERELLRSEEEGLAAVAAAIATVEASGAARASVDAATSAAARALRAHVRVLDVTGKPVSDSGPESVEKVTVGRSLGLDVRRSYAAPVVIADPPGPDGTFAARSEVKRALGGASGRATRVTDKLRSVRLFVAEPIRSPGGAVTGAVYVSRTTYPVLVSLYRVRNGLLEVASVSVAIALVVAVFLALTISRPLRRLTDAAARIARGERGVALRLGGHDEVGDLARAFDAMARELDARHGYVSELAANVSHEFKTPIASIRGAAELLRDGAADDPRARERFLGNILGDTERLAQLTTRLLELSRVEAQREARDLVDLRSLVEETVDRYRDDGHAVTLTWTARERDLVGNADQLRSVLTNLLDNATRFSPPGAPIEVRVSGDDACFRAEVSDRGAGISPANLPHVWDRFFTTARERGGTGLGLAIARAVVEAHGGHVGVESPPGQGATFSFALPRRV